MGGGWEVRGGLEVPCLCIPLTANIADSHKVGV